MQQAIPFTQVLRADAAQLASWLEPEPGHVLGDHLYVVDPMGYWMMRFPAEADPARIKRDLERLMRASQHWEVPSLNLAFTVTLGGGSRTDCESWFIVLEPLKKTS